MVQRPLSGVPLPDWRLAGRTATPHSWTARICRKTSWTPGNLGLL